MPKIARDAFLYLPPQAPKPEFAQCGTCILFDDSAERCGILGDTRVTAGMSCGLYIHGSPHRQPHRAVYKPEQAGLVDRQVRCENCVAGAASDGPTGHKCKMYEALNQKLGDMFDLDVNIEPQACCNAQTPKPGRADARVDSAVRLMDKLVARVDGTMANPDKPTTPQKLIGVMIHMPGLRPFLFEVRARTEEEALRKARAAHRGAEKVVINDARLDRATAIMDGLLQKMGRADAANYPVKLELELTQWEDMPRFLEFLKYIKNSANGGHSFEVGADVDADGPGHMLGKQRVGASFSIDGDGSDHIGRITVNGEELK